VTPDPAPPAGTAAERGSALIEFIGLAAVLLLPIVYALIAVLDVQREAYGVSAAARAYGRAFQVAGADQAAAAADVALRDQGLRLADVTVTTVCVGADGACTGPGGAVRVTVADRVALPLVPGWADDDVSIGVSGVHVAAYGEFRDAP
jgi:hypothetical protein